MRYFNFILLLFSSLLLVQCESIDLRGRTVQQGNLLPESKFARLKVGMTKRQVATLMGTSLLSPMFNNNRWDYAYTKRKGMGEMKVKRAELYFTNGSLSKINYSKS
jgi:outer membrane protein assembly factor BamE